MCWRTCFESDGPVPCLRLQDCHIMLALHLLFRHRDDEAAFSHQLCGQQSLGLSVSASRHPRAVIRSGG
jgi:hypothetical protein